MKGNKAKIVAEIGCNHQGSPERAFQLIDMAVEGGADVVKFQKRENRLLLSHEEYMEKHPVPANSFGDTYGSHREFLEFPIERHVELKNYCEARGVEYSTSVWDIHSAWEVANIGASHIKIPSACNTKYEILDVLRGWKGTLHVSLGMLFEYEMEELFERLERMKNNVILYACTSGYPVLPEETYLGELLWMKDIDWMHDLGYSGHHLGTNIDIAAYALGANWIERHFTFDKEAKGTDHAASLELKDLKRLRVALDEVALAMRFKEEMPLVELEMRDKLKR